MTTKERYKGIIEYFKKNVPVAESELHFRSPYELLVSVMLSAQCTDKRVNQTTPLLFKKYPTPQALANADKEELLSVIKSISYPNSKAAHLIDMANMLLSDFGGEVPSEVESLIKLPGVGRKTANVVASIIYNKPVIAVDTHVFRVAHRLGLSDGKTPTEVENDLEKNIAPSLRPIAHHWFILHGRYICTAKKPVCNTCPLRQWCATGS